MIKQRKKRVAAIINPTFIINLHNHHYQPTHQNPKTTNQNPLIKIPKPSNKEKKIAMAIGESNSDLRGNDNWRE